MQQALQDPNPNRKPKPSPKPKPNPKQALQELQPRLTETLIRPLEEVSSKLVALGEGVAPPRHLLTCLLTYLFIL